jgi:hypothetical protein
MTSTNVDLLLIGFFHGAGHSVSAKVEMEIGTAPDY